jgi:hypothetical protein
MPAAGTNCTWLRWNAGRTDDEGEASEHALRCPPRFEGRRGCGEFIGRTTDITATASAANKKFRARFNAASIAVSREQKKTAGDDRDGDRRPPGPQW